MFDNLEFRLPVWSRWDVALCQTCCVALGGRPGCSPGRHGGCHLQQKQQKQQRQCNSKTPKYILVQVCNTFVTEQVCRTTEQHF
jgi:hypothetical protein